MPPKQKRPAPSRGKQPPRKSARSVRPPAKLAQEPDSSEPSSDEAEVDLPLPPISPSPMVAPSQLQNTNQFLLEQIVSTNKRLDELVNRLDKPTPVPSTSAQVPLNPQALLTGALTHFLAEEETLADQALGESDFSSVMILGSTITEKTKAQIWANKYVDFSSLMSSREKNLSVTFDSATNQMIALSTNKPKPIVNIFQWLRLFATYASVYLEADQHKTLGPSMFSYMVNILDMHKHDGGSAWVYYDQRFRELKARVDVTRRTPVPWHIIQNHLVSEAQRMDRSAPKEPTATKKATPSNSADGTRFCYDYNNKGMECSRSPCRYRHDCQICGKKGHPKFKCFDAPNKGDNKGDR